MKKHTKERDFISAPIHKDFYYNKYLEIPTVIKEYPEVENILTRSKFIACITVQVAQLHTIEYQYGSMVYNDLRVRVTNILKKIKKKEFRGDDIFLVDLRDVDTFIIFLSPPRKNETRLLDHLEEIAEKTRINIENEIFNLFFPYCKEYTRPAIGYALVINNPMINNMRLIMQVLNNSIKMGEFMSVKLDYSSHYHLQKIIIEESIRTVFQPIVEIKTLDVIGYETLSRGPEESEFVSPLILFTLASKFGLSFELDSICRKKAFEAIRRLDTNKKIFVNTLTMTIHDPEFRGVYLEELFEDIKIKPENVVFEINEKLAIDNYDLFRSALKDYRDIGIVHASDDIGSGYADLERILELNPGYMKVDISMVRDIDKSYIKQQMVKAMVTLAKSLGSVIIAEGIETKAEYDKLNELDVTYGQGYLFGKPSEKLEPVNKDFTGK